jgi:predicted enzyme related to lactoylglutathione lyase
MVLAIGNCGIYRERFGVRAEDTVWVTEHGPVSLTSPQGAERRRFLEASVSMLDALLFLPSGVACPFAALSWRHGRKAIVKPTYFDLRVTDVAAARRFLGTVLGWQFERFPMPYEYYRIQAGPPGEPGIDGGIGATKDAPLADGRPLTQVTIRVTNLDEVLGRVLASGGRIVEPKMPIPGIGWYATCAEPGGLMFGLIQPAADVREGG